MSGVVDGGWLGRETPSSVERLTSLEGDDRTYLRRPRRHVSPCRRQLVGGQGDGRLGNPVEMVQLWLLPLTENLFLFDFSLMALVIVIVSL